MKTIPSTLAEARARDAADPLAHARDRFALPPGIYLDGNSLGARPRATPAHVAEVVDRQWGESLVAGWNRHDWIGLPARLGARIAPLIGAAPDEVIVTDSVSVNLFKLIAAALMAAPAGRTKILTEPGNFPTDLYIAQGVAALRPGTILRTLPVDAIAAAIDESTALVMLTHVHYRTARMLDVEALTAAAQAKGAVILWDLSHSTGAVTLDLNAARVDLAVGCGYKYLNGGPGAPGFLYVAERHQARLVSPLTGWFGHQDAFAFSDDYVPAPGISRFLCGTPPIIAMAALEAGLATFDGIAIADVVAKSRALSDLLIARIEALCGDALTLASPRDADRRGSHISFAHEDAYALTQALIAQDITGDFRAPDLFRLGLTPLYLGFADVWRAAETIGELVRTRGWDRPEFRKRAKVT